jgi:hypothetical protein
MDLAISCCYPHYVATSASNFPNYSKLNVCCEPYSEIPPENFSPYPARVFKNSGSDSLPNKEVDIPYNIGNVFDISLAINNPEYTAEIGPPKNNGATVAAVFKIVPVTDLSKLSESKKSYLLIVELSTVNKSVLVITCFPANERPFNFSA